MRGQGGGRGWVVDDVTENKSSHPACCCYWVLPLTEDDNNAGYQPLYSLNQ